MSSETYGYASRLRKAALVLRAQAVAVRQATGLPRQHQLCDRVGFGGDVAQRLVPLMAQRKVCVLQDWR